MINRIIPLLLFIGFVWAQTDFDKLVLKDGTTYLGEYSKIEEEIVYFKPHDAFAFQPIPVKRIRRLELKDGQITVLNGKVKSLALEEYQKLSTKEKAIYDAKTNGIIGKISIPKSLTSQDSKMLYEEVYFNKISQRKTRLILGSVAVTVGVAFVIYLRLSNLSMDFGGDASIITEGTISCGDWGLY